VRTLTGTEGTWVLGQGGVAHVTPADGSARVPEAQIERIRRRLEHAEARSANDLYHVTVLTSLACNLACPYCFQNTAAAASGTISPPRLESADIAPDLSSRIVGFIRDRMYGLGLKRVSLHLFGGEPLLAYRGCVDLLEKVGRDLPLVGVSMHTNGVLLTPKRARELVDLGLDTAHITFDGHRDKHDTQRRNHSGHGTYDTILKRIQDASSATKIEWAIRINVTGGDLDSLLNVISDLRNHAPVGRTGVYFSLIRDYNVGVTNEIQGSDGTIERFREAQLAALEAGFVPRVPRAEWTCGYCGDVGGGTGAVIDPSGDLYSCWETAGRDEFRVGSIGSGYFDPEVIATRWRACGAGATDLWLDELDRQIEDAVDVCTLDWLRARGRLRSGRTQVASAAAHA
jgi:uncharacterized protein